uniref:Uncharacterized protein n=1 Tax=Cucumis melo TaxID=3656 RepID=A0A9I9DF05_CUCME
MVSAQMRIVFGLLTFVTVGMIIELISLEERGIAGTSSELRTEFLPAGRLHKTQYDSQRQLPRGLPNWINDKEAEILRLGYVKPEVVSWSPRIIVLHNFLSTEECDYLKGIALPRLEISTVVDTKTGKKTLGKDLVEEGVKSDFRTSSGMFLSHHEKNYPMVQVLITKKIKQVLHDLAQHVLFDTV